MENKDEPSQQLHEIHDLMLRSSRFISLSGLSGIFIGVIALLGSAFAFIFLEFDERYFAAAANHGSLPDFPTGQNGLPIALDAVIVLLLTIGAGIVFTTRKARRKGLKIWDNTARRLAVNLFIPLAAGGIFCLILIYHGISILVPPATLIFYGLALLNASKYAYDELRILGISEGILGLVSAFLPGYGMIFWATGFGILHIAYGILMYYKYERIKSEKQKAVTE